MKKVIFSLLLVVISKSVYADNFGLDTVFRAGSTIAGVGLVLTGAGLAGAGEPIGGALSVVGGVALLVSAADKNNFKMLEANALGIAQADMHDALLGEVATSVVQEMVDAVREEARAKNMDSVAFASDAEIIFGLYSTILTQ